MAGKKLTTPLAEKEKTSGLIYVIASLFFLPSLLSLLPLSGSWRNFLYYILNFAVLIFLLRGFLRRSLAYAGKHIWAVLGYSVLGFGLYYVTSLAFSYVLRLLFPGFSNINDMNIIVYFSENYWLMVFGTVVLVPLTEELMHRALIFGTLYRSSPATAYIISMCLFGAIHVMGYIGTYNVIPLLLSFVQYLPAGLILAWCYRRSGCIYVPILIHTAVNAMAILTMR